jgi:hypothetical protein
MDEMKLKLSSNWIKGLIAKTLKKFVLSNLDINADILINEIDLRSADGKVKIHLDVDAEAPISEITRLTTKIGL